MLVSAVTQKIA